MCRGCVWKACECVCVRVEDVCVLGVCLCAALYSVVERLSSVVNRFDSSKIITYTSISSTPTLNNAPSFLFFSFLFFSALSPNPSPLPPSSYFFALLRLLLSFFLHLFSSSSTLSLPYSFLLYIVSTSFLPPLPCYFLAYLVSTSSATMQSAQKASLRSIKA
jgi:hypothetical protein